MTCRGNQGCISITPLQAAAICRTVGFDQDETAYMVAIAKAESSLHANNVGGPNSNGTYDFGIWQINWPKESGPPGWSNPVLNGGMAAGKYRTQGFGAWAAYNSGSYKAHLTTGRTAAATAFAAPSDQIKRLIEALNQSHGNTAGDEPYSTGISGVISDVGNAAVSLKEQLSAIIGFLGKLTQGETWVRFFLVVGGLAMLGFGIFYSTQER